MNYKALWSTHWFLCVFLLLSVLAVWLRLSGLGSTPRSLYWDEIAMLLDARAVAQTGKDMHGTALSLMLPSYGDYKLPVYVWLSAPATLLPLSPEVQIRLISALAGVATVITSGFISFLLLEKRSARERGIFTLATMAVVAILPWSLHFSHAGFEGHLGQLWVAISVLGILAARKNPWLLCAIGGMGVLGLLTYYSVRFVWPVVAASSWVYIACLYKPRRWLVYGVVMGIIFAGGWLVLSRDPWYSASEQFRLSSQSIINTDTYVLEQNKYRELAGNKRLDRIFAHRYLLQGKDFLGNLASHLDPTYLFVRGDTNLRHGTGFHGLAYLPMLPLLLIGIAWLWQNYRPGLLLLLGWWLVALVPASIPLEAPHALRTLNALVPFAICIGIGLGVLFLWQGKLARAVQITTMLLLVFHTAHFMYFYQRVYPTISASDWQDGYAELATDIFEQRKGVDQTWVSLEDRFYLWYLGYGTFSVQEMQVLETENFKPKRVGTVAFSGFPTIDTFVEDHTYILVSSAGNVSRMVTLLEEDADTELLFDKTVDSADGGRTYRIIKFIR